MWKVLFLLSIGIVTGITSTVVYTTVTTHVTVGAAQPCIPAPAQPAEEDVDLRYTPSGRILSLR